MIKPSAGFLDGRDRWRVGQQRAPQHEHWQAKGTRSCDLPVRRAAPTVLRDNDVDAMGLEERAFVRLVKRAPDSQVSGMRHGKRGVHGVHAAHEIMMLGRSDEWRELLAAEREENPARVAAERAGCDSDIQHLDPTIAGSRNPWRSPHRQHGCARLPRCMYRVGGNGGGIGMRRIDQRVDALAGKVLRKSPRTAKTANPDRHRLRCGRSGATRKRKDHVEVRATGKLGCEVPCFRSAAEYQDSPHGRS